MTHDGDGHLVKCYLENHSVEGLLLGPLRRGLVRASTDYGKRSTRELIAICEEAADYLHGPDMPHSVAMIWDLL